MQNHLYHNFLSNSNPYRIANTIGVIMLSQNEIWLRMKRFESFGNQLPHAKVYYRIDWETVYFDLDGKMFGLMSPKADNNTLLTLKGDPEANIIMRELYNDVIPGYHTNKKHWNSIRLNTTELSDTEVEKMIKKSYDLVWLNLPQSVKDRLRNGA